MTANVVLGLIGSVVVLVAIVEMMRRHRLREKYAVIWFLVATGVLALAIFPGLLNGTARLVGVAVPANLLFFMGSLVLLVLTLQHSYELGRLEEKTRTLAEEIALLRLELTEQRPRTDDARARPPDEARSPTSGQSGPAQSSSSHEGTA